MNQEEALALMAAANVVSALLRKALQPMSGPAGRLGSLRPIQRREPPIPLAETIADDYLVCLEDGARVKSLKAYLKRFGLTPDQYREKWGLPPGYPMVAPTLSEKRAALARHIKPHLSRQNAREARSAS